MKSKNAAFFILTTLGLVAASLPGRTQVLFDNGSAGASSPTLYFGDTGYEYTMAGNVFTPTASGAAGQINFAGAYAASNAVYGQPGLDPSDSFVLSLYSVSNGAPDELLASSAVSGVQKVDTGFNILGAEKLEVYNFSGTIATPFTLATNQSYYLGFTDTTNPYGAFGVVMTDTTGPADVDYSYYASTGTFQEVTENSASNTPPSLAFELSATPEPSAGMLGCLAGLALIGLRCRAASTRRRCS
jgi:hypothetical protein